MVDELYQVQDQLCGIFVPTAHYKYDPSFSDSLWMNEQEDYQDDYEEDYGWADDDDWYDDDNYYDDYHEDPYPYDPHLYEESWLDYDDDYWYDLPRPIQQTNRPNLDRNWDEYWELADKLKRVDNSEKV